MEIELSLPGVRRTILLPRSLEYVSYTVFFQYAGVQNCFFSVMDRNDFEMTKKNLSHFGQNV